MKIAVIILCLTMFVLMLLVVHLFNCLKQAMSHINYLYKEVANIYDSLNFGSRQHLFLHDYIDEVEEHIGEIEKRIGELELEN